MIRIKICGLFRDADIDAVNAARPDFVGFVFAPSRRRVTDEQARTLRLRLDPAIVPVGVFVDAPIERIAALHADGTIAMAQLHGHEDEATILALKRLADLPVVKAVRMPAGSGAPLAAAATTAATADPRNTAVCETAADPLAAVASTTAADYLLLDSGAGGTGRAFDWRLVPALAKPYFLAGGIGEQNIEAALALMPPPYCIDISSGAESDGIKDAAKILRLVERVRRGR